MKYATVCSGIECASVAWKPLGWEPQFFSEIEPFPSALLAHHYPDVPNHGDMTGFKEWPDADIDLLAGGTPCQSFSVAGLRRGLDDPRGDLMLTYLAIAARYRPRWLVWENVPGVLSSNGGRDFGAFLTGLGECGYGFAFRVLDAQHTRTRRFPFAVPQRRRRVFVVGYLGDWRRAAAVLFDRQSLRGDPAPRREAGEGTAADAAPCLTSSGRGVERTGETRGQDPVVAHALCTSHGATEDGTGRGTPLVPAISGCLSSRDYKQPRAEDNVGIVPVAFAQNTRDEVRLIGGDGQSVGALAAEPGTKQQAYLAVHGTQDPCVSDGAAFALGRNNGAENAVAFTASEQANSYAWERYHAPCLTSQQPSETSNIQTGVRIGMAVRRLTPTECERLMGIPDGYTRIPYRNKPADQCPDGPRYKALGNGWATNCAEWIGERIKLVEALS